MKSRLPESRALALKSAEEEAERIFQKPTTKIEIFSTTSKLKKNLFEGRQEVSSLHASNKNSTRKNKARSRDSTTGAKKCGSRF
jgi:hypothetical protein